MTIWKAKPSLYFEHPEGYLFLWVGKTYMVHSMDKMTSKPTLKGTCAIPRDALTSGINALITLEWNKEHPIDMARWNPKPALCFQRVGYGYVIVIGKQVVQFDEAFNRKGPPMETTTFFAGCQHGLLMIGSLEAVPEQPPGVDNDETTATQEV